MCLAQIFQCLEGSWLFQRSLSNFGKVNGVASFIQTDKNFLYYKEEGSLILQSDDRISCFQEYIYRCVNDAIVVYFSSDVQVSREFLRLEFFSESDSAIARASHLCGEDNYDACYEIYDEDNFCVTFEVRGPKKDYKTTSHYSRMHSSE